MFAPRKLGALSGVASGATLNTRLPKDGALECLIFDYAENGTPANAAMFGNLTAITIEVEGQQTITLTGTQLHMLNGYYGNYPPGPGGTLVTGKLPLFFSRPGLNFEGDKQAMLLNVPQFRSVDVRVTIGAGITAPTLNLWASWGPPPKNANPYLYTIRKHNHAPAATGQFQFGSEMLKGPRHSLLCSHLTRGNVTVAQIKAGSQVVFERDVADDFTAMLGGNGRTVQSNTQHFDFWRRNILVDGLLLDVSELLYSVTLTSATTAFEHIQERWEKIL